jgi:hypothetical protein
MVLSSQSTVLKCVCQNSFRQHTGSPHNKLFARSGIWGPKSPGLHRRIKHFDGLMRLMIRDSRKSTGMRAQLSNAYYSLLSLLSCQGIRGVKISTSDILLHQIGLQCSTCINATLQRWKTKENELMSLRRELTTMRNACDQVTQQAKFVHGMFSIFL